MAHSVPLLMQSHYRCISDYELLPQEINLTALPERYLSHTLIVHYFAVKPLVTTSVLLKHSITLYQGTFNGNALWYANIR